MNDRRTLNTWKEIAAYLSRGVRTVQRWELAYGLPVRRVGNDAFSVFAYADEIDAWMQRVKPKAVPYVRPTVLVVDVVSPNSLSNLKLAIEAAKFNVLTAFTATEALATAAKYDVNAFVIDAVLMEEHPAELALELHRLYPGKPRLLVGEDEMNAFDASVASGDTAAVVAWLVEKFGKPAIT